MNQNHGYSHQRDQVYTRVIPIGETSSKEVVSVQEILVLSRYALPTEMGVLLKHRVQSSATLTVNGALTTNSLDAAMGLIYSLSASPKSFSSFPDDSKKAMEEACSPAMAGLLRLSEQMKAQQRPVIDPRTVPRGLDLLKR